MTVQITFECGLGLEAEATKMLTVVDPDDSECPCRWISAIDAQLNDLVLIGRKLLRVVAMELRREVAEEPHRLRRAL
jgi:hypothetical protein